MLTTLLFSDIVSNCCALRDIVPRAQAQYVSQTRAFVSQETSILGSFRILTTPFCAKRIIPGVHQVNSWVVKFSLHDEKRDPCHAHALWRPCPCGTNLSAMHMRAVHTNMLTRSIQTSASRLDQYTYVYDGNNVIVEQIDNRVRPSATSTLTLCARATSNAAGGYLMAII